MFGQKSGDFPKLTPTRQELLRAQTIGEAVPGTILCDFAALLEFVSTHNVTVSGVKQVPGLKFLPELNRRMARPLDVRLQRPQLKSFANIEGLYLLLRCSGLARIEKIKNQIVLRLDADALAVWQSLNATERYFMLLETWLLFADEEVLGDRGMFLPLDKVGDFVKRLAPQGQTFDARNFDVIRFLPGLAHLWLLEAFGLLEMRHAETPPSGNWSVSGAKLTPFGSAVFALLAESEPDLASMRLKDPLLDATMKRFAASLWEETMLLADEENADVRAEEAGTLPVPQWGQWQPVFQPYFPEWRQNFALPEPEAPTGTLVFKVALGKAWRRIAVPAECVMDALALAILDAFDFDDDHLYAFYVRDRFGLALSINHPFTNEPPLTDALRISALPLTPGGAMVFHYDFGADWEFVVTLECIEPGTAAPRKTRLLESHGEAPEQYPDWD